MKKPALGDPVLNASWAARVTRALEVVMGRFGKTGKVAVTASAVSSTPTAADFNKVVDDLNNIKATVNKLLDQVQD